MFKTYKELCEARDSVRQAGETHEAASVAGAPEEQPNAGRCAVATGSAAFLREEADRYEGISKLFGFDDPADEERQKKHCAALRAAADEIERLRTALLRIVHGEMEVEGLRPQFAGHGIAIAFKALSLPNTTISNGVSGSQRQDGAK